MPFDVDWLIDRRVVHVRFHGIVSADDVRAQSAETIAVVEQGVPPVHVFVDASAIDRVDLGLGELRGLAVSATPGFGWMIVVAPNSLYRFFISIAAQFMRGTYKFVASQDEALEFLRQQDVSLPKV